MLEQVFARTTIVNDFAGLGEKFSTAIAPQPLQQPEWVHLNQDLAQRLGLDLTRPDAVDALLQLCAGQSGLPAGKTVAAVYSGHQFGVWAGQLGDGRAHLLGRVVGPSADVELQLKGSGRTPYSRMGDGRAVLRSSIREYLASHAMYALGVPTTEALALVRSDDPVYREQVERAAIVLRTAPTFLRFGSFEHWQRDPKALAQLIRYTIAHFFPHLSTVASPEDFEQLKLSPGLVTAWLREIVEQTARLIAHWQTLGFCHGVMNTDNMSIIGLTIDYGPYAFMDEFYYAFTPNTTDRGGRYAWYQQPPVAFWNLTRLASVLLSLDIDKEDLQRCLEHYEPTFWHHYNELMRRKMGLSTVDDADSVFFDRWWKLLNDGRADVTLSFRYLADYVQHVHDDSPQGEQARSRFLDLFDAQAESALTAWLHEYAQRSEREPLSEGDRVHLMRANSPLYVVRNHLAQRCIHAAENGDYDVLEEFFTVLSNPFTEQAGMAHWATPPGPNEQVSMLSCSS
ncbi:MAG TPA: YdiU family protein [Paenalcaligenes sp.]|nr:YdiU family protein [Paenalcaligenes sp.]